MQLQCKGRSFTEIFLGTSKLAVGVHSTHHCIISASRHGHDHATIGARCNMNEVAKKLRSQANQLHKCVQIILVVLWLQYVS